MNFGQSFYFILFFCYWVLVNLEFRHWVDVDVGCAEEQSVCAKCHCCVGRIVGRFCLIKLLLWYVFIYSLFILRVSEILFIWYLFLQRFFRSRGRAKVAWRGGYFFIFLFFPSPLCQIICMNSANKDWFCVLKVNGFGAFFVGH